MSSYRVPGREYTPLKRIILMIFAVVLAVLAVVGIVVWNNYREAIRPVSSSETAVPVTIPEGSSTRDIAVILADKDLIRADWAFFWYTYSRRVGDFRAGTYRISPAMSVAEIVEMIRSGDIATDLVTILPGQRLDQVREGLIEAGFSPSAVDEAFEATRYRDHPVFASMPLPGSLEGFLYPESFFKVDATTLDTIIRLSLDEMADALSPEIRDGIVAQGLTLYEGIILASIVEREVSDRDIGDRPQAAQVFIRRLNIGMRLQSNTTDSFPSEYDTYAIEGLPPTPISNVTISSLKAVASPSPTEYLYFVSGSDCITRFSFTVDEHETLISQHGIARPEDNCR